MKTISDRQLLIAGIDSGVHTSIALLDLDGRIVFLKTIHSPKISEVLKIMTRYGNVISVSTDRRKPPARVKKVSSSLGSRLISPYLNMTNKKKRILIGDHPEGRRKLDSHQKAALASAIFAFRRFNRRFKKLKDRLEKEGRMDEYGRLKEELVTGGAKR